MPRFDTFQINDLGYYVWALHSFDWPSAPGGQNVTDLVPNHRKYEQANLATIDNEIESELQEDADHQRKYWLHVDRAAEAVGMLEGDGMDIGDQGRVRGYDFEEAKKKYSSTDAFISLVKPNLDVYKQQLQSADVGFEMVAADPAEDAQAIENVNEYKRQILNNNGFDKVEDNVIHEGAAYGSGVMKVEYDRQASNPDLRFVEEQVKDGKPLSFEEYMRFRDLTKAHIIDYVPTFEMIRCRYARGRGSWDLSGDQHPYTHRVREMSVTKLRQMFPDQADRISPSTSEVYNDTNPESFKDETDHNNTATLKETWITCPVNYNLTVKVQLDDGTIVPKRHPRSRDVTLYIARIEDVGVVDMVADRYSHGRKPFVQWVNYPSVKHSCGVGLVKYGYAPQRVHNIMFSGKLRFFQRMVKGGGFFIKGAIDRDEIKSRSQEHSWIGIDYDSLPPELQNQPISQLVHENTTSQFPAVYDRLESQAAQYVNISMNIPGPKRGEAEGTSGRQDMAMINQNDQIANNGIRAYEAMYRPLGEMVLSNIVQFDGEEEDLKFITINKTTGKPEVRVLNEVQFEELKWNPIEAKYELYPVKIKNNIKNLKFDTRLSTRSIIPDNPAERRSFIQQFMNQAMPLTETLRGITMLRYINNFVYGGVPGFSDMINDMEKQLRQDRKFQKQQAQKEQQREDRKLRFEQAMKKAELQQDQMRLKQDHTEQEKSLLIELLSTIVDAAKAESQGANIDFMDILNKFKRNNPDVDVSQLVGQQQGGGPPDEGQQPPQQPAQSSIPGLGQGQSPDQQQPATPPQNGNRQVQQQPQ